MRREERTKTKRKGEKNKQRKTTIDVEGGSENKANVRQGVARPRAGARRHATRLEKNSITGRGTASTLAHAPHYYTKQREESREPKDPLLGTPEKQEQKSFIETSPKPPEEESLSVGSIGSLNSCWSLNI